MSCLKSWGFVVVAAQVLTTMADQANVSSVGAPEAKSGAATVEVRSKIALKILVGFRFVVLC